MQPLHQRNLWPDSEVQDTHYPQPGKWPPEEPLSFRMALLAGVLPVTLCNTEELRGTELPVTS